MKFVAQIAFPFCLNFLTDVPTGYIYYTCVIYVWNSKYFVINPTPTYLKII